MYADPYIRRDSWGRDGRLQQLCGSLLIFAVVSTSYFRKPGASAPLPTAITFAVLVALLDLVIVASFVERSLAMFGSFTGSWFPFVLIFAGTWMTGKLLALEPAGRDRSQSHSQAAGAP